VPNDISIVAATATSYGSQVCTDLTEQMCVNC